MLVELEVKVLLTTDNKLSLPTHLMSLEVGKSDGTSLYTTALGRVKARFFLLVRNGYCSLGGEVASRLIRLTKKRSY